MHIEVQGVQEQVKRNFKRGDVFPVIVVNELGQKRIFFNEFISVVLTGSVKGVYVPDTRSVYDSNFFVASGEEATITFKQD